VAKTKPIEALVIWNKKCCFAVVFVYAYGWLKMLNLIRVLLLGIKACVCYSKSS